MGLYYLSFSGYLIVYIKISRFIFIKNNWYRIQKHTPIFQFHTEIWIFAGE